MTSLVTKMVTMKNTLAAAVRRAVKAAPASTRQLALEAGIDPSLLTRILTGEKQVSIDTAAKLEAALTAWRDRCADGAKMIRGAITQRGRD